ncbi:proline-rich receptor-like protein kinase PERK2 [Iris pallida]|uniref:Proline-rich receptor-like protein kinase PERK2 n=1 Tax=Iris pallida TaxID=29817 RepID=A0AAX6HKV6_IRIPA|nr:proline-rich receptor-like protein kinase PERK2 [Iris pallida]
MPAATPLQSDHVAPTRPPPTPAFPRPARTPRSQASPARPFPSPTPATSVP